MNTYEIPMGSPDQQPFSQRIEKMCGINGAFLNYKKIRRDILIDKESRPQEEPYHLKMLREQEEEHQRCLYFEKSNCEHPGPLPRSQD